MADQPQNQPPQPPRSPAQQLELLQQKVKEIRKRLWQSALLALTALIAICVVGIAWFVNNNRVTGSGVQVQTSGPPFELASVGDSVGVTASPQPTGVPEPIDGTTYFSTSGSNTLVAWMMDSSSNLNNTGSKVISPGSSGQITFYVLPKQENLGAMRFTLSLIPYAQAATGAGSQITIGNTAYAPVSGEAATRTADLLAGHLLFFAKRDDATHTYSQRLTPGTAFTSVELDAAKGNITGTAPVAFTIYWVWPELFRYYIDTNGGGCLFAPSSADSANMIRSINTAPGYFYDDGSGTVPENIPTVGADITTDDLNKCSGFYNNADQYLGTNIRYLQFQLDADQTAPTP